MFLACRRRPLQRAKRVKSPVTNNSVLLRRAVELCASSRRHFLPERECKHVRASRIVASELVTCRDCQSIIRSLRPKLAAGSQALSGIGAVAAFAWWLLPCEARHG
jgi:hypothetical protein